MTRRWWMLPAAAAVMAADHFTTEWEFFEKGQRTQTEVEHFSRVK